MKYGLHIKVDHMNFMNNMHLCLYFIRVPIGVHMTGNPISTILRILNKAIYYKIRLIRIAESRP